MRPRDPHEYANLAYFKEKEETVEKEVESPTLSSKKK